MFTNMVDAAGTTKYTYTALGELLTEDGPWASDTVTYGYHASVPRLRTSVSLQQPSGSWTQTYNPDAAKRLASVVSPAGTFTYTYRGAGNLWTNLALPNTGRITNAYSSIGALTNTTLRTSGGTVTNRHSYVYNMGHQRTRQTRTDASYVDYTYDPIGQLRTAVGTGGQSTENLDGQEVPKRPTPAHPDSGQLPALNEIGRLPLEFVAGSSKAERR